MARPSKLTPEITKRLVKAIEEGNYYEAAAAYAGINYATLRRWLKRGEAAKSGKYREFCEAIKKAEAIAEARVVALWQSEIPGNWKAAATFLERRYPDRWGRRHSEITGPDGGPIQIEDAKASLIRKLERAALSFALEEDGDGDDLS